MEVKRIAVVVILTVLAVLCDALWATRLRLCFDELDDDALSKSVKLRFVLVSDEGGDVVGRVAICCSCRFVSCFDDDIGFVGVDAVVVVEVWDIVDGNSIEFIAVAVVGDGRVFASVLMWLLLFLDVIRFSVGVVMGGLMSGWSINSRNSSY